MGEIWRVQMDNIFFCGNIKTTMPIATSDSVARPVKMLQIPDLMASLAELDENTVSGIRKTTESPPRVSVIDVICVITGSSPHYGSEILHRLIETYPEVSGICGHFKFRGQGQRDTYVTDAVGITRILLLLPGRAAAVARQSAANVVVRYLGGDTSLVAEIMENREMQAQIGPDNPAAIFGQSVQGPTPHDIEMAKNSRMQALGSAFQLAQAIESTSLGKLRAAAQKAIDDVLLPMGDASDQFVDAAMILQERAHTEEQIARLAGELGRDLKMVADDEERIAPSNEQQFGEVRKQVGLYHRIKDASLIEAVMVSFKDRQLYERVMAGEPDPNAIRRVALLDSRGRGRSRSQRH